MYRCIAIILLALAGFAHAGTYLVNQQAELLNSPRPTASSLFFQFVSNQAGYDTEMTLSNTSADTLGSTGFSGTCTLYYTGQSSSGGSATPLPQTTAPIMPGQQLVFTLSQGGSGLKATPGFQGYITVTCAFALVRGFSKLIAPGGSPAAGTDAELIPTFTPVTRTMIFPYVTSKPGFDTLIAIDNATLGPYASPPTPGTCTIYYYGLSGSTPVQQTATSGTIQPGTQAVFLLSSGGTNGINGMPNFSGYMVVSCGFSLASGVAFVMDSNPQTKLMSELPEYIPTGSQRGGGPTSILFPVVSSQGGQDAHIAISNTTFDSMGTVHDAGTCTVSYEGSSTTNSLRPQTSSTMAAGDVLTFSLASGGDHGIAPAPGFNGYLLIDCSFPLARAWGYQVSPAGSNSLYPEYLNKPRTPTNSGLLFSAVTSRAGYDTTITLANTSQDPYGTATGTGPCRIAYYGSNANGSVPSTQTTLGVQPGTSLSFSIGNGGQGVQGQAGFRGYVIADCTFPLARGMATTQVISAPPFGSFDTPTNNSSVSGAIGVSGWALSPAGITGVDVWREPNMGEAGGANGLLLIGPATLVAGARPDVQALYPNYAGSDQAGWGLQLLTNELPGNSAAGLGNGTYKIHAIAHASDGQSIDLGTRTITVNNATSLQPFGTIDTPTQGGIASGANFTNFGWAVTPQPNIIPKDGSSISVILDNRFIGHPTYNQNRADLAALFPGLQNSAGAAGFLVIDTTKLTNGLHTIAWVVTDSAGNSQGIGSRFFTVQN